MQKSKITPCSNQTGAMNLTLVTACLVAMLAVTSALSDDEALTLAARATPDPLAALTHVANDLLKQASAMETTATRLRSDYTKKGAALQDITTKSDHFFIMIRYYALGRPKAACTDQRFSPQQISHTTKKGTNRKRNISGKFQIEFLGR